MLRTMILAIALLLAMPAAAQSVRQPAGGGITGAASAEAVQVGVAGVDQHTRLLLDCEWRIRDTGPYDYDVPDASTATVSTAQEKWGDSSCYFNGSQSLEWTDVPAWHTDGDFAFDAWVRFAALPADGFYSTLYSWVESGAFNNYTVFLLKRTGASYYLSYTAKIGGSTVVTFDREVTVSADTWYHVAISRSGDDYRVFLDGTQAGSTETDSSAITEFTGRFTLGELYRTSATGYLNGYLDEVRLSVGASRYTGTFTAPTDRYGGLRLELEDAYGNITWVNTP